MLELIEMLKKNATNSLKLIVFTGGVLSGIGKGVLAASIGSLLKKNFSIIPIKCDGYLNADPGTMNPIEHGEVFVLDDGGEVDMDFGHYERFMNVTTKKEWNITMGKIYKNILEKERKGKYLGKTVQLIPHATDEIKKQLFKTLNREKTKIGLIEIGGTVGDIENELFIEAIRQIKREISQENIMFIHLTYIPFIYGSNEYKSKPTQNSVRLLNQKGIYPDMLVCRSEDNLTKPIKEKIALHCGLKEEKVISIIDIKDINHLPFLIAEQGAGKIIKEKLKLKNQVTLERKKKFSTKKKISIIIAGKYTNLEDSYASIREALKHSGYTLKAQINIIFINTSTIKTNKLEEEINQADGVIIPGGFGIRGLEGKIEIIKIVREKQIPFLGICLGMQLMIIEYARHVCKFKKANSTEAVKKLQYPVIDLLSEQKKVKQKGASMRLGGQNVLIQDNTLAKKIYQKKIIRERFRHRYEVNNRFVPILEKNGLVFSGSTTDQKIKQIVELPNNSFFLGCQFHPELISRVENPSPVFSHFLATILKNQNN